jgi:hypothetical protein
MNENILVLAIKKIAPNSEFSFTGVDIDSLKWDSTDVEQPTKAAILTACEIIEAEIEAEATAKAAAKAAGQAKLAALGLTAEEIAAL